MLVHIYFIDPLFRVPTVIKGNQFTCNADCTFSGGVFCPFEKVGWFLSVFPLQNEAPEWLSSCRVWHHWHNTSILNRFTLKGQGVWGQVITIHIFHSPQCTLQCCWSDYLKSCVIQWITLKTLDAPFIFICTWFHLIHLTCITNLNKVDIVLVYCNMSYGHQRQGAVPLAVAPCKFVSN